MAVKFGRKLKALHKLGTKVGKDLHKFGGKALHQIDIGERKLVNTLDKVAPVLAVGADLAMPGSGEAVLQANEGVQSLHKSGRKVVKEIDRLARVKRGQETEDSQNKLIGSILDSKDNIQNLKQTGNKLQQMYTVA